MLTKYLEIRRTDENPFKFHHNREYKTDPEFEFGITKLAKRKS